MACLRILLHFVVALLILVILQVRADARVLTLLTQDVRVSGLALVSGTLIEVVSLLREHAGSQTLGSLARLDFSCRACSRRYVLT